MYTLLQPLEPKVSCLIQVPLEGWQKGNSSKSLFVFHIIDEYDGSSSTRKFMKKWVDICEGYVSSDLCIADEMHFSFLFFKDCI